MNRIYIDTETLIESYSCLKSVESEIEQILDYQNNINTTYKQYNNEQLNLLLLKVKTKLESIKEKILLINGCLDDTYSIAEWYNEESIKIVSAIDEANTSNVTTSSTNSLTTSEIFDNIKTTWGFCVDIYKNFKSLDGVKRRLKDGYVILSNYKRGAGIGSRYKLSTYMNKFGKAKITALDFLLVGAKAIGTGYTLVTRIQDTLNDDSKSNSEKAIDITANSICCAASVGLEVAAVVAGKAVTTATTAIASVYLGPVLGVGVGVVAGTLVEGVISTAAEVIKSEEVVGVAKAGCEVVSAIAGSINESDSFGEKALKVAGVAVAAVATGVAVAAVTVVETVKSVGQKIANLFKRW